MKKSQASEDDDMFLMSLLTSIKILYDFQKLELKSRFSQQCNQENSNWQDLSLPFNSVPTTSNSLCPPTPHPCAASLDSTYSLDSDTSAHTLQISCISSVDLLPRQFQFHSEHLWRISPTWPKKNGLPVLSTQLYTLKNLEQICKCNILLCVFLFVHL